MTGKSFRKIVITAVLAFTITAAASFTVMAGVMGSGSKSTAKSDNETAVSIVTEAEAQAGGTTADENISATTLNTVSGGALDTSDIFTERDLEQSADLSSAQTFTVTDGQNIEITSDGVYVISGSAKNASIIVNAGDEDKVQIVLDGVSITNESTPCIYVKSADKVFVTTTDSENTLTVTGSFTADGDTNTDAVIFSKDDLVITGGAINITCASDAIEANDSIRIAGGEINITTEKDGLHAENDEDDTTGFVYICGGTLNVLAEDDGIHATTIIQIDGGEVNLNAHEGLEATWIQINDGTINIQASDDAINAAYKSAKMTPVAEFNGGTTTIVMGSGDTDAVDSNGNLIITGGTLNITAQSPFDYDGTCEKTGGTLIINGTETDSISNQMMGGGRGGKGGGRGGW